MNLPLQAADDDIAIEGVVRDAWTGRGIPHAALRFAPADSDVGIESILTKCGETGRFRMDGFSPGTWHAHVEAEGYLAGGPAEEGADDGRVWSFTIGASPDAEAPRLALWLVPEHTQVQGRVANEDGDPVANATVLVRWSSERAVEEVHTDDQGAFAVTAPPTPAWAADWAALAPGYVGPWTHVAVGPDNPLPDRIDLELVRAATVRGTLHFPDGAPSPGRHVTLGSRARAAGQTPRHGRVFDTTDANGAFELHGVPPGRWRLDILKGEGGTFVMESVELDVQANATRPVRLTDRQTYRLEVRLQDEAGAPLPDEQIVLVCRWMDGHHDTSHGVTDRDGVASLTARVRGPYEIVQLADTGEPRVLARNVMLPRDAIDLITTASVRTRTTLSLVDADGVPVKRFSVVLFDVKERSRTAERLPRADLLEGTTEVGRQVVTFTGPGPVRAGITSREAGPYEPPERAYVDLDSKSPAAVVARLSPPTTSPALELVGHVVDESGKRVEGVRVELVGDPMIRSAKLAVTTSDAEGRFVFASDVVPPDHAFVRADFAGPWLPMRVLDASELPKPLTLLARRGGSLGGRLTADWLESFPDGARVDARWDLREGEWELGLVGWREGVVGSDGTFTLDGVPTDRAIQIRVAEETWQAIGAADSRAYTTARAGEQDVRLCLQQALSLAGTVVGIGGCDIHAVALDTNEDCRRIHVQEDGTFQVTGLTPGRWELQIGYPGLLRHVVMAGQTDVEWTPPDVAFLDLTTKLPDEPLLFWSTLEGETRLAAEMERAVDAPPRIPVAPGSVVHVTASALEPASRWVAWARGARSGEPFELHVEQGELLRVRADMVYASYDEPPDDLVMRSSRGAWRRRIKERGTHEFLVPAGTYDVVSVSKNGSERVLARDVRPGGDVIELGRLEPIR
ncbi:MAG: carboxypeptidase regulatory-like domain-containing protein [Planctomycetota bacterium]